MTDDLGRLEAETRKALENFPGLETRVAFYGGAIPHSGVWVAFKPAAILSLIQRVRVAEAAALQEQKDSSELLLIAHLNGADMGRKAGRREALEEAAKWHEAEITRLEDQIEHNNEYARRSGNFDGEANDFCRSLISNHRSGAAAIRALQEKAG